MYQYKMNFYFTTVWNFFTENDTIVWKNGQGVVLQVPADFYNYLVKGKLTNRIMCFVNKLKYTVLFFC